MKSKHKFLKTIAHVEADNLKSFLEDTDLLRSAVSEIVGLMYSNSKTLIDESGLGEDAKEVKWHLKGSKEPLVYSLPTWWLMLKKSDFVKRVIHSQSGRFVNLLPENDQYLALEAIGGLPDGILTVFLKIQKT